MHNSVLCAESTGLNRLLPCRSFASALSYPPPPKISTAPKISTCSVANPENTYVLINGVLRYVIILQVFSGQRFVIERKNYSQPSYYYLDKKKKRTIIEIRGEKNAVPRVISCSIRRDQRRAKVADSRESRLPCADRAWYHTWNSILPAANGDDGSFFLSRVVLKGLRAREFTYLSMRVKVEKCNFYVLSNCLDINVHMYARMTVTGCGCQILLVTLLNEGKSFFWTRKPVQSNSVVCVIRCMSGHMNSVLLIVKNFHINFLLEKIGSNKKLRASEVYVYVRVVLTRADL